VNDDDPILQFSRGDVAKARILKDALRTLRESSDDDRFRGLMDDVLEGRTSLREATRTQVFDQVVTPLAAITAERMDAFSEEELERLAAEGKATEDEIRERYEGRG
jgi:6-phosphogluconate dehydrogenase (decarboxylating)